jgi:Cof subfamily protein (haloacid dehalogenase superfamily)
MMPMPQSEIKLVLSDVDGTLVTPGKNLTDTAHQAILKLRQSGFRFTIISSRPPYGMRSLARELQLNEPLVAFNGGMLVSSEGKCLREYPVPETLIPAILDCLWRFQLHARLFTASHWLITSTDDPYLQHEICTIETEPTLVTAFPSDLSGIFKITGISQDFEAVARCEKAMQGMLEDRASAIRSQPYYLDMTHPLANKGHGLVMIAENLRISKKEIAVLGDMLNDVPMFRKAGLSIAMGNASDEVKQEADYTTASNTDEGFAKAIDHIILKRSSPAVHTR